MIHNHSVGEDFNLYPNTDKEAMEQCIIVNRILANEGILDVLGHISVRNPVTKNTFFQACRSFPGDVTREDILEIDLEGNIVSEKKKSLYREVGSHAVIFAARPDVNAICHSHCDEWLPYICTDTPMRPLIHEACMFVDGIHTMKREQNRESCILQPDEYPNLLEALGNRRAVFIKNHGAIMVDDSPIHLVAACIFLRKNAIAFYKSSLIGEPVYIDTDAALRSCQEVLYEGVAERIWKYCLQRVRRNMPDLYW